MSIAVLKRLHNSELDKTLARIQSEAMLIIVFSAGAEALDMSNNSKEELANRVIMKLHMVASGAHYLSKNKKEL